MLRTLGVYIGEFRLDANHYLLLAGVSTLRRRVLLNDRDRKTKN